MTKGIIILKALLAKRRLKEICESYDISYKYCYGVAEGNKNPSWDLMNKMRFLIPADFWFEETDSNFMEQIKTNIAESN